MFGLCEEPVWFQIWMPAKEPAMLTAPRRSKSMLGNLGTDAEARGRAMVSKRADLDMARASREVDGCGCEARR